MGLSTSVPRDSQASKAYSLGLSGSPNGDGYRDRSLQALKTIDVVVEIAIW